MKPQSSQRIRQGRRELGVSAPSAWSPRSLRLNRTARLRRPCRLSHMRGGNAQAPPENGPVSTAKRSSSPPKRNVSELTKPGGTTGRRSLGMIHAGSKLFIAGAMVLAAGTLGGCATKKFVREQAAIVGTRVDTVNGRVDATDTHVAAVEGTAKDALDRAVAAGKLAEGKFLYSEVLSDDSMKFKTAKADLSPEAQQRLDAFVEK